MKRCCENISNGAFKDGKIYETKFFAHSVQEMNSVFLYIKEIIGGNNETYLQRYY